MRSLEEFIISRKESRLSLLSALYLSSCVGVSAFSLGSFMKIVQPYLSLHYDYTVEGFMVIAQVGFQWLFMWQSSWKERTQYLFIALTVSMIGSLLLLPLLLWNSLSQVSPLSGGLSFLTVVLFIFMIHHRLIIRSSLPRILSGTWVLYRLLLLLFVLSPRDSFLNGML